MRCTFLTLVALIACRDKALELPPPTPPPHDGVTLLQPGAPPLQVIRSLSPDQGQQDLE